MQAFTDLVGTSASVPTHAFLSELTELTPTLDTATATHDTSLEASSYPPSSPEVCMSSWAFPC